MKPATHTVNELFERDVRYVVPLFQRPYVWDREDQWEPLWEDICVLLDHQAEAATSPVPSHFLGAIVLEQDDVFVPGAIPVFTVIDGQQRLTTLQLLLAAAAAALREAGAEDDAELLDDLVRNNPKKAKGDELFKVWPTNANRAAFAAVMAPNGPAPDREDDPDNRIDEAYAYFRERIAEWLSAQGDLDEGGSSGARALLLRITLVDLLRLVSITLEAGDNAQVIFETLNARGTPLLALDLVKNAVFHAAARHGEEVETLYEQRWRPELDADYWRQERVQGRLRRPRGELFLMHWLAMKLERVIPATELFAVFRKDVLGDGAAIAVRSLIDELCRDARIMRGFDDFAPASPEGRFFGRLELLDTSTLMPLALLLFRQRDIDPSRRRRALAALESWLVRRGLMRLTSQTYNREIPRLLAKVAAAPERADEVIVAHLRAAAGQASRWPSDDELVAFLVSQNLYGLVAQKRLVMALSAVEEAMHGDKTELLGVGALSLEHVMPQSWQAHWPLPQGVDETEAIAARSARIHRLGNLTLTSMPLNAALSNSAWERKQRELNAHTRLFLNVDLVDRYGGGFGEAEIDERSVWLADAIRRTWPGPDDLLWLTDKEPVQPVIARHGARVPTDGMALAEADLRAESATDAPADFLAAPRSSASAVSPATAERMVRLHHEGPRLRGRALSDAVGLPSGWTPFLAMLSAEPRVYPHIRLEPTGQDVVAAREGRLPASRLISGEEATLRWERIAARAGITAAQARELYDSVRGPGAARRNYTGRGRRFPTMD
ncbi:DUF262 domain-containing protein [Miltoncostaea oceani]|uniref:DUF262 domain-containing protein n=1 Tax=Miltoncostaea oceani TaxID=2843216 RepID=UPI001C3E2EB4|nr:DUF262 domain-containing protein [Miltoncostaea oceani]